MPYVMDFNCRLHLASASVVPVETWGPVVQGVFGQYLVVAKKFVNILPGSEPNENYVF